MEKTLVIDGKDISFKSNGASPLRYKMQFGKDFFAEIVKMGALEKLGAINKEDKGNIVEAIKGLDFDVFYNIAWVFAKTADKNIPDPLSWLDTFDEFPMLEIIPELQDMILSTIQGKKK
jgi:hypothetical protein